MVCPFGYSHARTSCWKRDALRLMVSGWQNKTWNGRWSDVKAIAETKGIWYRTLIWTFMQTLKRSPDIINKGKQIIICNLLDPLHKVQARVFQFPANIISIIVKNSCKNIIYCQHWLSYADCKFVEVYFYIHTHSERREMEDSIWINHSK